MVHETLSTGLGGVEDLADDLSLSLLGGDATLLTTSNFSASAVGAFQPGKVRVSFVRDDAGRLRMDGKELVPEVQREVEQLWPRVETGNIDELTDFAGYQQEFLRLFGFGFPGVDYDAEVDPVVPIANLVT